MSANSLRTFHRMPRGRRLYAMRVAIGLSLIALALGVGVTASSASGARAGAVQTTCVKNITVLFYIAQDFPPVNQNGVLPNGCWNYGRVVQNTTQFMICKSDGSFAGSGYDRVFDDTNPKNNLTTENNNLTACANLAGGTGDIYAEDMAARNDSSSTDWCQSSIGKNVYSEPCWRRNNAGGTAGTIHRYMAELYSSQSKVDDLKSNWTQTNDAYGADSANSYPVINIQAAQGDGAIYQAEIGFACSSVANGGFIMIYAGSTASGTIDATDRDFMNTELNDCTT